MKLERLKLERSNRSWTVRGEVGKLEVKLESSSRSWKNRAVVGNVELNLEILNEVGKLNSARFFQLQRNFQTSAKLSNFKRNYPTSVGSFQLRWVLSKFGRFCPTSLGSFKFFELLVFSNCLFKLNVSHFSSQNGHFVLK